MEAGRDSPSICSSAVPDTIVSVCLVAAGDTLNDKLIASAVLTLGVSNKWGSDSHIEYQNSRSLPNSWGYDRLLDSEDPAKELDVFQSGFSSESKKDKEEYRRYRDD